MAAAPRTTPNTKATRFLATRFCNTRAVSTQEAVVGTAGMLRQPVMVPFGGMSPELASASSKLCLRCTGLRDASACDIPLPHVLRRRGVRLADTLFFGTPLLGGEAHPPKVWVAAATVVDP